MDWSRAPEGLHEREYAAHLLTEVIGWPATRFNLELMMECVKVVASSKTNKKLNMAHDYLERAVRLAKQQAIPVDKKFFEEGKYTSVRPATEKKEWAIVSQERDKICESHGCMSGWVYADKGVIRCEKCRATK